MLKKGLIYIILSTVLFSTMEIALKLSASSFNPIQLTFLRFAIGSLILLPLSIKAIRSRGVKLNFKDVKFFALSGFICVVVSMVLYQLAVLNAPANVVAVIFSINPVFVVVLAFIILREKIYKHTIISLAVSIVGLLIIMNPLHMPASVAGITLSLLAAATFALYGVFGRGKSERYGGLAMTCFSFIAGSIEMFLLILITKISPVAGALESAGFAQFADIPIFKGIAPSSIPALIFIGVFVTGLGYAFYFLAMEKTDAATASLVFYIKPALAPIFALVILGEPIKFNMIIGIVLMIAGSIITFVPSLNASSISKEDLFENDEIAD